MEVWSFGLMDIKVVKNIASKVAVSCYLVSQGGEDEEQHV
jgi:hypothetical protein